MELINLLPIPNQAFSIVINEHRYDIAIKTANETCTVVDVSRDNIVLITGSRAVANGVVLKSKWMMGDQGNFFFETPNGEIPYYTQFGDNHRFWFATIAELEGLANV